jgi:hypothetical protein
MGARTELHAQRASARKQEKRNLIFRTRVATPNILLTRAGEVVWWWMVGWVNTMLEAIRGGMWVRNSFSGAISFK